MSKKDIVLYSLILIFFALFLDKILVSYGNENDSGIKKQMNSITNLAPRFSANKW